MNNFQHTLSKTFFEVFSFIERASENELMLREMVGMMGWELEELTGFKIEALSDSLRNLSSDVLELSKYVDEPPKTFEDFNNVLRTSEKIFGKILDLNRVIEDLEFNSPQKERLTEFGEDILNYIITLYLKIKFPIVYHALVLLTVIRAKNRLQAITTNDNRTIRHSCILPSLEPGRIPKLLANPIPLLGEEYFPNKLQTDRDSVNAANKLFPRIEALLNELGLTTVFGFNKEYEVDFGTDGNRMIESMLTAFAKTNIEEQDVDLAVSLALSPASREDLGLVVIPSGNFNFSQTFDEFLLEMKLSAGIEGFAIGRDEVTLLAESATTSFDTFLSIQKLPESQDAAAFLWGSVDSSHFLIGSFLASNAISYSDEIFVFDLFAQALSSSIKIAPSDGDGFINRILPPEGLELDFDFGIGWSNQKGLYFKGQAGLEAIYPINKSVLNSLLIKQLTIKLFVKDAKIQFLPSLDFDLMLGPLKLVIHELGLKFGLEELGEPGNIGFADLSIGFKPPTGVGLKIDAAAVQGGGFLRFDPDKEEYSGVLELTIKEKIALKAIGIITTKLPNGQEGYSLLLLISAEFTPIQLGFGFTLNGVGGLIAVHRGMDLVSIRLGVQNKTLDHILFPEDPLANAPQITASLDSVFPIAEDNYSFGLMALIGWGVPTLLEVELGLLISFPANDIAVVGTLSTTLPNKKTPLLILNVAFAGTLSFENKYLYFDARIDKSSRLLSFALSGDMALRVLWGEEPNFVLSVGGFHPDFEVPEKLGLEGLQRITLNLLADDNPRLLLKCYFALTSNTAQFGATIDFFFKKSKFKVVGFFYIHALFQFSPFYFIIALGATLDVKLGTKSVLSVGVEGSLEGPTPWKAKGKGKFKIWWVKYSVSFNKTWGESKDTSLPNIAVFPELKKALEDDRNWAALLPKNNTLASLRELDDPTDPDTEKQDRLTLHPMASLSLIQHVVPLNINIEKFGSQKPADFKKFSLSFETGGQELDTVVAKDFFAPAQFFALSKEEKISRKSYEKYPAGLRSDADKLQANFKRNKEVEYEFELIDAIEAPPSRGIAYEPATHLIHWNKGNAIAQSQLGKQVQLEALVTGKKITYSEEEFVIVKQDDLTPIADIAPATEFEIQKTLDDLIQKEPQLQDQYITVPAYEIL